MSLSTVGRMQEWSLPLLSQYWIILGPTAGHWCKAQCIEFFQGIFTPTAISKVILRANVNPSTAVKQWGTFLYISALVYTQSSLPKSLVTPSHPPYFLKLVTTRQEDETERVFLPIAARILPCPFLLLLNSLRAFGGWLVKWRWMATWLPRNYKAHFPDVEETMLFCSKDGDLTAFQLEYFSPWHSNGFFLSHPTPKKCYRGPCSTSFLPQHSLKCDLPSSASVNDCQFPSPCKASIFNWQSVSRTFVGRCLQPLLVWLFFLCNISHRYTDIPDPDKYFTGP